MGEEKRGESQRGGHVEEKEAEFRWIEQENIFRKRRDWRLVEEGEKVSDLWSSWCGLQAARPRRLRLLCPRLLRQQLMPPSPPPLISPPTFPRAFLLSSFSSSAPLSFE